MDRRQFAGAAAAGLLAGCAAKVRPNVLWITTEDIGPEIGAYGDKYADTPSLDKFAARAWRYDNCWSNAPVCAPARTTLISGMYPPSTGSEHMRSETHLPAHMKMYPQLLREAGYYATNNEKEDYNLTKPGKVWDESSKTAHWRNRAAGQPFFAVFNITITHESQIRRRPHSLVHDPAGVRLPAYYPDAPEVRHDWAQYYDNITTMDGMAGKVLADLDKDGLTDDTIVFFYGDHGAGMPRSKRWPYNSGLHVPLLLAVPDKFRDLAPAGYRAGGTTPRLVSFVDFAPTLLSLCGIRAPDYYQGHAFLGPFAGPEQRYLHGFRGRMGERTDMIRSVRDNRYVYMRHYMPHRIYGQHQDYTFEMPTVRVWKRMYEEGKLNEVQRQYWEKKPPEALFDLQNDRDEVNNLAGSSEHHEILERLRKAQRELAVEIRDVGFLPEGEIHSRSEGSSPYEMGHDPAKYPLTKIMAMAELASDGKAESIDEIRKGFGDADPAVRYWSVQGVLARESAGLATARAEIDSALGDSSPYVRAIAAEALGRYGTEADRAKAVAVLIEIAPADKNGDYAAIAALNSLSALVGKTKMPLHQIAKLSVTGAGPKRVHGLAAQLVRNIIEGVPQ